MVAYSLDLRQRIVDDYDAGVGTQAKFAERYRVSLSFAEKLLRQWRRTGSIAPLPHRGGQPRAIAGVDCRRLQTAIQEYPDDTLIQLRDRLGFKCSLAALTRAIKRLRITRKKSLRTSEQDEAKLQQKRRRWFVRLARANPCRYVFLDESWARTDRTPTSGRSPCGTRCKQAVPQRGCPSVTLLATIRVVGVGPCLADEGSTDTDLLHPFLVQKLLPTLQCRDILVMDHLSCHRAQKIATACQQFGLTPLILPTYSPDLNPVEQRFSKVKTWIRRTNPRSVAAVVEAMGTALSQVNEKNCRGWYQHVGFTIVP